MNNLQLLLKNDSFRFDPKSCRSANIALMEAKLLRWLFLAERDNAEVIKNFGLGLIYKLLNQGLVENSLGVSENAQTNLWQISAKGMEVLKKITGAKA